MPCSSVVSLQFTCTSRVPPPERPPPERPPPEALVSSRLSTHHQCCSSLESASKYLAAAGERKHQYIQISARRVLTATLAPTIATAYSGARTNHSRLIGHWAETLQRTGGLGCVPVISKVSRPDRGGSVPLVEPGSKWLLCRAEVARGNPEGSRRWAGPKSTAQNSTNDGEDWKTYCPRTPHLHCCSRFLEGKRKSWGLAVPKIPKFGKKNSGKRASIAIF